MNNLELKIARRYLRTKKKEGMISIVAALSIVGIALGVATLIIVLSVMNGFRTDLMARILGVNSHVSVYSYQRSLINYEGLVKDLEANPAVSLVTPTIEGNAVIYNPSVKETVVPAKIRGVPLDKIIVNKMLNNDKFHGDFKKFRSFEDAEDGVLIGSGMAADLGVYVNDQITLMTPQSRSTVFGSIPNKKTFRIAGVFTLGMNEYDKYMMYMPLDAAQGLFGYGDGVESLGVEVKDLKNSLEFAQELNRKIGNNYRIVDWQMANSSFFGAVQTERNVMFIILTMIVLVASFNIVSSMIMLVKDKSASIAILRTMGMGRGSVLRIFMMLGSFNGIVGTLSGLALGLLFCFNIESIQDVVEWATGATVFNPEIYFLTKLPAEVNWGEVGQVTGISLLISLLATIYPSWRAARVQPAEILRYE